MTDISEYITQHFDGKYVVLENKHAVLPFPELHVLVRDTSTFVCTIKLIVYDDEGVGWFYHLEFLNHRLDRTEFISLTNEMLERHGL